MTLQRGRRHAARPVSISPGLGQPGLQRWCAAARSCSSLRASSRSTPPTGQRGAGHHHGARTRDDPDQPSSACLEAAGSSMDKVVKVNVILAKHARRRCR